MEGFERYLESLFGPGGKANVIKEKMDAFRPRWIRDTTNNQVIDSKVQEIANVANNAKREPKVCFFFVIFGHHYFWYLGKND